MVQRFVAFIILAIGAVNSCYAFDLDVFQNSNQKPLVLAIILCDGSSQLPGCEAEREAKRKAEEDKRKAEEVRRQAAIRQRQADAAEAKRQAKIEAERQVKIEAERQAKIAIATPLTLTTFKDCPDCPEMVKIPAGKFMMGSVLGEGKPDEYPQHQVSIREFAVARFEVSFKDWDDCLKDGVCDDGKMTVSWRKEEMQPLNSASWVDAQNYVKWLSRKTGKQYRLLTEAEWEYVARAGTTTRYWWGNSTQPNGIIANCDGCGSTQDNRQTAIITSFNANPFGLYNIAGNVFEWVEDCYHENYNNAPVTGAAWSCDNVESYAVKRVLRGGGWSSPIEQVRSASRKKAYPVTQLNDYGVRVARSLP